MVSGYYNLRIIIDSGVHNILVLVRNVKGRNNYYRNCKRYYYAWSLKHEMYYNSSYHQLKYECKQPLSLFQKKKIQKYSSVS